MVDDFIAGNLWQFMSNIQINDMIVLGLETCNGYLFQQFRLLSSLNIKGSIFTVCVNVVHRPRKQSLLCYHVATAQTRAFLPRTHQNIIAVVQKRVKIGKEKLRHSSVDAIPTDANLSK